MGRHRSIDRSALLDAAERVVARDGAAHLTLDAVAHEAGVSKAGVLYDYGSKRSLIHAMVERRVEAEEQRIEAFVAAQKTGADALLRGHLAAAADLPAVTADRSVALSLCAALAQDETLRDTVHRSFDKAIHEIAETSSHPRGAMLAFLAIKGLSLLEWFRFYSWPKEERDRLLADMAWLIEQSPGSGTPAKRSEAEARAPVEPAS